MLELARRLIEENKRTKDTFLDLGNCELGNKLPPELVECAWIEKLNLGSYYYSPKENRKIKSNNSKWHNIFNGKELDILQALPKLRSLSLNFTQIKDYSFVKNFNQLKLLDLSSNSIYDIGFLKNLTQLEFLDLNSNYIQDINPILDLIKNGLEVNLKEYGGVGISLYGNLIINPPLEIVKQGREAILRYFDRIEQEGKDFIFEAKLTLVGDGGSGKTSLQSRMLDEKAELPKGNESTRGIKVNDWEFKDANAKTYITHIWDFGGQDVYYPVHRFFLTENSVYILMASTRFAVHNFDYWIPTIYQFGGNSPIVLVQTCDNGNEKEWTDIKPFYNVSEYNLLKPIYKINLSTFENWGLKKLKGFIQHNITELPHIGEAVPKSWVKVREALIEKAETVNYISFERFSDLCIATDNKAFSKAIDVEDLARFLHDIGIILWYHNKELLKNFVIIKPEWAMNAVYKIIDDITIQQQNGIIYQSDFKRIWEEETYHKKISELKSMLWVFKIAFPKQHKKDDYLLPARLNLMPDYKLWPREENSLRLEYHFDFMPRGIINQLSADLSNKIVSDESVWSDAVIFKQDTSQAQVIEETHKKKILINAKGRDARGLMVLVMHSIDNIIKEYRGVVPLLRVPCNCSKCQTLERPTIFEYEKLLGWLEDNRREVICNESLTTLSISQLLYSVGLEPMAEKGERKGNQMGNAEKAPSNGTRKLFISYSKFDEEYKNELQEHMISLKREKLVEVFDDRELELGDEWDEVLKQKIDECDYFVCLVSRKFLNVPYIYEVEMPRAFKAGKKIIPIIIKPCDWMNTPINDFNDTDEKPPKLGHINAHNKGKVIGLNESYVNQNGKMETRAFTEIELDGMWLEVVNQIRALIRKDS